MAGRPVKTGLDYFPMDTIMDTKMELIDAKFPDFGFKIIVRLWMKIYFSNGYYIKWNDDEIIMFSKSISTDINSINDVINYAFDKELFSKKLYEKYGILTSNGIQKRYIRGITGRKNVPIIKDFWLCNEDFSEKTTIKYINNVINLINVDNNSINASRNNTNKIKLNKIKLKPNNNLIKEESKITSLKNKEVIIEAHEIINLFNKTFNKSCRLTPKHREFINARIKEGYSITDFEKVFYNKLRDPYFIRNPKYYRIQTLCGTKFDSYLNEAITIPLTEKEIKTHIASQEWLRMRKEQDKEIRSD